MQLTRLVASRPESIIATIMQICHQYHSINIIEFPYMNLQLKLSGRLCKLMLNPFYTHNTKYLSLANQNNRVILLFSLNPYNKIIELVIRYQHHHHHHHWTLSVLPCKKDIWSLLRQSIGLWVNTSKLQSANHITGSNRNVLSARFQFYTLDHPLQLHSGEKVLSIHL